jgi:hypothetical protein
MSSTDDGESAQQVQRGRKAGRSVSGAPFPPGRAQSDGPERPTRQVPTTPDDPSPTNEDDVSTPTTAQEGDGNGS